MRDNLSQNDIKLSCFPGVKTFLNDSNYVSTMDLIFLNLSFGCREKSEGI